MNQSEAYAILGLGEAATEREVRRAYRALLFKLEDEGRSDPAYPEHRRKLDEALEVCLANASEAAPAVPEAAPKDTGTPGQRVAVRLAIGLFGIAALVAGYQWLRNATVDPTGDSKVDTAGMIAAIEHVSEGTRIVTFGPDGKKVAAPGVSQGYEEHDLNWRPDGNRLLWVSNRDGDVQIYRWAPGTDSVEKRSTDSRGKSAIWFHKDSPEGQPLALVTLGGRTYEYDQRTGTMRQVLPPSLQRSQSTQEGEGSVSQMEAAYRQIGDSFIESKAATGHPLIWSRMHRELDEVFVASPLSSELNKGAPAPILAGRKLDFDVAPNGTAIIAVRDYQFLDPAQAPPEFLVDGRPVPPIRNGLFILDPSMTAPPAVMAFGKDRALFTGPPSKDARPQTERPSGTFSFGYPRVSPDGSAVAFVLGREAPEGRLIGEALVVFPLSEAGGLPRQLAIGEISSPNWSPDGKTLVFSVQEPGKSRVIFTVPSDASGPPKRFSQEGDYTSPVFSPQLRGSG
ncbi:MAG: PD40 domain-containing protein [Fimbriimonadaceae bacterium]|nr:PD40 domain-containing protein [Fimbriimonadaceae bacterium]QYK56048.1 MAG: PD40 domain-containing protein [Fimbriimonadaceae bacterium]